MRHKRFCDRGRGTRDIFIDRHPLVDAIGKQSKADLYLLTAPDVRLFRMVFATGKHIRKWMHDRFAEQLTALSHCHPTLQIAQVNGPYDQRLMTAIASVRHCSATEMASQFEDPFDLPWPLVNPTIDRVFLQIEIGCFRSRSNTPLLTASPTFGGWRCFRAITVFF